MGRIVSQERKCINIKVSPEIQWLPTSTVQGSFHPRLDWGVIVQDSLFSS